MKSKHVHSILWFSVSLLILFIALIGITNYFSLPQQLDEWEKKADGLTCTPSMCVIQEKSIVRPGEPVFATIKVDNLAAESKVYSSHIAYDYRGSPIESDTYLYFFPKTITNEKTPFAVIVPKGTEPGRHIYTIEVHEPNKPIRSDVLTIIVS